MKTIMKYKHVVGANMAINHLVSKNIRARLNEGAGEDNAWVLVESCQYKRAVRIHDSWRKRIISQMENLYT